MSDPYGLSASELPPELIAQLVGSQGQKAIAEAMLRQSMQPLEAQQAKGRFQGVVSPLEAIAKLVQGGVARGNLSAAEKQMAGVAQQQQEGLQSAMQKYQEMKAGTPKPMISDDFDGAPAMTTGSPNPEDALAFASTNPYLKRNKIVDAEIKAWEKSREPYTLAKDAMRVEPGRSPVTNKGPVKPMVEHNFPLGSKDGVPMVQSHISLDEGKTWQPMPGSQPVPKFAPKNDPGERPFYQAIPTTDGIMAFNARTGKMEPMAGPQGGPLVKPTDDASTQARIAAGKEGGKEGAKANQLQYESAQSAADNLAKIDKFINHMKTSNAITGMGADAFKNIERAKAMVTNSIKAGKTVSDTEIADIMMGAEVFPLIKELGIGARGMDTPAEREFMRNVLTGTINLNKDTLLQMANIRKAIAERTVQRFNERVDKGELDNWFRDAGRTKQKFGVPAIPPEVLAADKAGKPFVATQAPGGQVSFQAPPGIDPKVWAVMTPEERKLFQ